MSNSRNETILISFGYGDSVYEENKHNKKALRNIMINVFNFIHDIQNTKGGLNWSSRDIVLKNSYEFVMKYNCELLWMN